ncbi:MAG: PDGLE domain-containing protein [Syntrophothermus sp.]|uniref:PDGLE domain-containing protein n=1 Tax=Syntrophothermus sp. TaxID=2736299 RepID=UPI00257C49CD|nr:PDGLE domain-containing protein [Syntrophothermus sp.]NSW81829.1 PDGLE domain-containing protein [Syntrophothermus sp.]
MVKGYRRLLAALIVLVILCPLGLLATGTAFGEWGIDELVDEVGYIPAGLAKYADLWKHAPLPDYSIPGFTSSFLTQAFGYIVSAVLGMVLVAAVVTLWVRLAGTGENK